MTSTPNTSPASERVPVMVEIVAQRLHEKCGALSAGSIESARELAREAIAAMRDLPYPVRVAARDAWRSLEDEVRAKGHDGVSRVVVVDCIWRAALDEALR